MNVVYCPICHRRLFDVDQDGKAEIEIKCPHCKQVIKIEIDHGREKNQTEQVRR